MSGSQVILVTGGTGFLGQHLISKLLIKYPAAIVRALARDGNAMQQLLVRCSCERLVPIIGDIRSLDTVAHAMKDVSIAIHLAALKHIDLCELHPQEAVAINIHGTENLLSTFCGDTFIGMSTDKAAEATNCYGATKLIMEKLILDKSRLFPDKRYMVIRSGNLFGSTGSVIARWRWQIRKHNWIEVTNPMMTRFFIDVNSVVEFILTQIDIGRNGSINIPYQKSLCLSDLALAVIAAWGNSTTAIRTIAARSGEKTHESLFAYGENVVSGTISRLSCDAPSLSRSEIDLMLRVLDEED